MARAPVAEVTQETVIKNSKYRVGAWRGRLRQDSQGSSALGSLPLMILHPAMGAIRYCVHQRLHGQMGLGGTAHPPSSGEATVTTLKALTTLWEGEQMDFAEPNESGHKTL